MLIFFRVRHLDKLTYSFEYVQKDDDGSLEETAVMCGMPYFTSCLNYHSLLMISFPRGNLG